jgi:Asp-tRNA(Asn)/Glu-tRNA(Gln) amidotransferase A subunit family amidase
MSTPSLLLECACEQARSIAAGTVDAGEFLRSQMVAIDAVNPEVNAFVTVARPQPRQPADAATSPLANVGFAVKDNIDVRGLPSHSGLRALHAQPAARHATVVARLEAAGLLCLGKLNMHAVALGATNHNVDFGDCHNPRRLTHTPGGSSGGSGAAVAAGLCGIALGTDTMGSVRLPAAYCGVVGFKPSFEAIAVDGVMPLCRALDHVGLLARCVEDVVQAFRIVADMPLPARSRIGFEFAVPSSLDELGLQPEVRSAFELAIDRLRNQGFRLRPLGLTAYPFSKVRRAGLLLSEAELLNTLAVPLASSRDEMPADLLAMLDYAASRSAADLARALSLAVEAGQWVHHALLPFDGLLMPTASHTAFAMDGPVPREQADFTAMANMSGGPAISLPLPVPAGTLPIGLQLMGRRGDDWRVLDAAKALEEALR